jgi:hypothetical protein
MAILTTIDNIPVFSTPREVKSWGLQYGVRSYHIHYVDDKKGYMAGTSHDHIKEIISGEGTTITNYSARNSISGGSSTGGGY